MKVYLIYFEWSNTKGNHAGMAYLAQSLERDIPNVKAIRMIGDTSKYLKVMNAFYAIIIAIKLRIWLKPGDKVFLMEYLARSCFQDVLAKCLKLMGVKNEISGLVHLAGNHLLEIYGSITPLKKKLQYIDRIVTLGSSLTEFMRNEIEFNNVVTTFHYVDTDYYKPIPKNNAKDSLTVLSIGATKRDFAFLRKITDSLPKVHFQICQGRKDLSQHFNGCKNVELLGYMSEDELLYRMQTSDINLSVMEDTIGSNVITTALAVGMILVVSDVGSIRDYCSEKESFLCKTQTDFIKAIDFLRNHTELIPELRMQAIKKGEKFSYYEFKKDFRKLFIDRL